MKVWHCRLRREGPYTHHPEQAEAIGDRAGEWLAQPPQQVLHGDGEAEHVAAPGVFMAHRLHEEAEARARPETQQRYRAPADDDHERRPPGGSTRGWTKVAGRYSHKVPLQANRIRAAVT